MGPTNPNRLYLWTGMVDPNATGGGPVIDNSEPGFSWMTYPERLESAGVSWKVYQEADNFDDNEEFNTIGPENAYRDERGVPRRTDHHSL